MNFTRCRVFHGEVINLRDVITFDGETVNKLKGAFHDSVEDYLNSVLSEGRNLKSHILGSLSCVWNLNYIRILR